MQYYKLPVNTTKEKRVKVVADAKASLPLNKSRSNYEVTQAPARIVRYAIAGQINIANRLGKDFTSDRSPSAPTVFRETQG